MSSESTPLLTAKQGASGSASISSSSSTTAGASPAGSAHEKPVEARAAPKAPSWRECWKVTAPLIVPASRSQTALMALALLSIVAERIVHVLPPLAMKAAVDAVAENSARPLAEARSPYMPLVAYVVLETAGLVLATLRGNAQSLVELDLDRRVSVHLFRHLHSLSLDYHLSKKSGVVVRVMDRGVHAITTLMNVLVYELVPTLFEAVLVTSIFYRLGSVGIAVSTFISVVGYTLYSLLVTGIRVKLIRESNEAFEALGDRQVESLGNFETVKSFGKTEEEVATYHTLRRNSQTAGVRLYTGLSYLAFFQSCIYALGQSSGLMIGAFLTVYGEPRLTAGDYVLISMYISQLFGPLMYISYIYRDVTDSFTDVEKAVSILLRESEIKDAPGAVDLTAVPDQSGDVVFKNVSFHYKEADPDIVDIESDSDSSDSEEEGGSTGGKDEENTVVEEKAPGGVSDISFHIPAGNTLALCGQSGSGKSTITRLLLRLYDCDEGQVLVNGYDVRSQVAQDSLRSIVGIVSQEVVLFNDTLRANVAYGKPDASDVEIRAALEAAALGPFLEEQKDGLDTIVGERGLRLSGGERQRVGNARVLLKDPQIMVLDEATSALDSKTEKQIQTEVRERSNSKTTLIIAHRLSTIVHADEIILLNKGRIKERGTHGQLLALGGEYAKMWRLQTSTPGTASSSIENDTSSDSGSRAREEASSDSN